MTKAFTILIADRNRHVRTFLEREMTAEGYKIVLAKNGREVVELLYRHESLDLILIDPDLPDASELDIMEKLQDRIPVMPVVVHTFVSEYSHHSFVLSFAAFVEKDGSNIDQLKSVVSEILKKSYPHGFETWKNRSKAQPQSVI